MLKAVMTFTLLIGLSASAQNLNRNNRNRLQVSSQIIKVENVDIQKIEMNSFNNLAGASDLSDIMNPLKEAEVVIDKIINMGDRVWKLLLKGRPAVDFKHYSASALPQGAQHWTQLQDWSAKSQTVQVSVKNGFGKTTSMTYKVIFSYNGSVAGTGKYIGYATVEPAVIRAEWTAPSISASVAVPVVFNMGTSQNPVAAMKIQIAYSFDSGLEREEHIDSYILIGNGQIESL